MFSSVSDAWASAIAEYIQNQDLEERMKSDNFEISNL
jgi:hypothetical protein